MEEKQIQQKVKMPLGIKFIIGFHLLNIIMWTIGQGGTVIAYDRVAKWGLQDPRSLLDPVIVEVNRGIGLADVAVIMPLFIIAVIGLWRLKFFGAAASWMVFGFSIYWPAVYWASQWFYGQAGFKYLPTPFPTTILLCFIVGFSLWASWYLLHNYKVLN
ncbi:MAG: hypothetical protein AMJ53_00800 [Gammaproteobacteria bacterium SG8_11]|nr:MAG: hypothetical protein AMJ53_00800 [Gammaproteobacteria bacterium SG8_11]